MESNSNGGITPPKSFKKLSKEEFIRRSRLIHGDKYDYSKVEYVNNRTKVCIICPTHGEFWQTPGNHMRGNHCPVCVGKKKSTTEEFIIKSRRVYGDRYDYSKVEYVNNSTPVCIICSKHGEFWQIPYEHIYKNCGCPKCSGRNKTTESLIEEFRKIHGDKYDYSKVEYVNNRTKVCIICPTHGEFWQTPRGHLQGKGCKYCAKNIRLTTEEFIKNAKQVHGDKYDYSKVEYVNNKTRVCIICPDHGEFWQTPNSHLSGNGCPSCNSSKLEESVAKIFPDFIRQQTFDWLKFKSNMFLDFYSPDLNIAIECQGEQHFKVKDCFGGEDEFKNLIERDLHKFQLCQSHNIKVLYYFPEECTPTEFYSDKLCFHTLEDLKSYINLLSL